MPPIRILYDLASSNQDHENCDAAQRYALEVSRCLAETRNAEVHVVGERFSDRPSWIDGLRQRRGARAIEKAISDFQPDIVHRAGHLEPADYSRTQRTVETLSDSTNVAALTPPSTRHLICPTENARRNAMTVLGVPGDQVSVVPSGVHAPCAGGATCASRGNFFLFVGARSRVGEFDSLLQAVATTPTLADTRIVACSGGPLASSERRQIASLGLQGRVIAASGDDLVLSGHYASALALVHPRFRDDFGLVVLEAMAHGCPVACSRTGGLPEIGGDAALYFDPADIGDIGTTLVHLAADSALRERMSAAGLSRAGTASWGASAERMLSVYRAAITTCADRVVATASGG